MKLKGVIKKFDQRLYDKYDTPARNLVKEKLGDCITDNPDIYAADVLINHPGCKYKYIELQVCANWVNKLDFPYKEPFVQERKGHFSNDTLFIIFSRNFDYGLLFDKESLDPEPVRKYKYARSFVYKVSWRHVVKFDVENLNLELLELFCL